MKSIHFFPGKDVCFAKLLLTCHRAIAQSKQRYARGEEKREAEHIATDKGSGGATGARRQRGGKHLWMMDERWEGLQTVRCSLYLSMRF